MLIDPKVWPTPSSNRITFATTASVGELNSELMEFHMSVKLTLSGVASFQHRTRFVFVNDRVPRAETHCALCSAKIETGYVRESQTRLLYCDAQCFAGHTMWRFSLSKLARGKYHEMLKP